MVHSVIANIVNVSVDIDYDNKKLSKADRPAR